LSRQTRTAFYIVEIVEADDEDRLATPEQQAANANLIAAAPELFDALEELLFMTHPRAFGGSMEEARATANAAIAKATGG
jgi:hypothetical protein